MNRTSRLKNIMHVIILEIASLIWLVKKSQHNPPFMPKEEEVVSSDSSSLTKQRQPLFRSISARVKHAFLTPKYHCR
ncbi:hypothetical protein HanRHA438_Chr06g0254491 [Helianthus annuus]|nr:hypothetical protein HanHA300_Chr06g0201351 [Helianthus annuus]KAJ0572503.1 hypothetical protein HanHA89_Chr06g0216391 [Helianthus annuus]KAJ0736942.1 hypothetical protein HanLR1_Chr06g0201401 [Helianthus annuus]KAJ0910640.1 hypothetical protein HanRHA438_Chr06g0254491 [Helianthus annuus]